MSSLLVRRDIDFILNDWLVIGHLAETDTVNAILDLSEKLATEQFVTHYKRADREEPKLEADGVHVCPPIHDALRQYADLGLFSASFSDALGGMALPNVVCMASFAYFAAANISTSGYAMLTVANARLIAKFGTQAQIEQFALPEIAGRWFGTMCLSEPQAGSSLADVATRADYDGSDALGERYRLTGNKMWISGGDQNVSENIVHLVLAKIPTEHGRLPDGTEGLSLFIVPKVLPDGKTNDVRVAGLNHKMGYRGTSNCLLNFGEAGGAIGWRIGETGQGLRQMFQMMNEARIGVGLGAAALGYRSHRLSVAYARERTQGRELGTRNGRPVAIIEHPDVKRMLLAQKAYVEGALALCLYCARLVDEEDEKSNAALLGLLTPVAKTWPSEYGLIANDIAIQIHGGYGYTRDFDVEQLWRDNRLNPIHEGTTGIQAIDLLGRKILRDNGDGLRSFDGIVRGTIAKASKITVLKPLASDLDESWAAIGEALTVLRESDQSKALNNATHFLWAFGHVVLAWIWLDKACVASSRQGRGDEEQAFLDGKIRACLYFFESELPKINGWLETVAGCSDIAAAAPSEIF